MTSLNQSRLDNWLSWDRNESTINEVKELVRNNDNAKLVALMNTSMKFGTAGLRAAMGAGFSRMNDLTVIQAAQGLAAHIIATFPAEELKSRGIVIGYDARHNSERFARLSANVMLSKELKVYLFRQIVPTPFVAFAVKHLRCLAGVMVTASHNPKEDNGYKVYWDNGAQITSPVDEHIAQAIDANQVPSEASWVTQNGDVDCFDEIEAEFYKALCRNFHHRDINQRSELKFTYTAMHGVGAPFAVRSLTDAGFKNIFLVGEQCTPDPEFPTVKFPNPEEGKSSLNLAIKTADNNGSTIILANDPDADRLAVAQKLPSGSWSVLSGNHIGALLAWWALESHKKSDPNRPVSQCVMLSSAVSSAIIKSMSAKEGFHYEETLTGFKYMGSRASELTKEENGGFKILFAFEEAIGYMYGDSVWDKDGVTAVGVFAEMSAYLKEENMTPLEKLNAIYDVYGTHISYNSYKIGRDPIKNINMFEAMRKLDNGDYPKKVCGVDVIAIRDLGVDFDTSTPDRKATLPSSALSPMITFYFSNAIKLTLRCSGTEPKVKWYSEIIVRASPDEAEKQLKVFVDDAVEHLMDSKKYDLEERTS